MHCTIAALCDVMFSQLNKTASYFNADGLATGLMFFSTVPYVPYTVHASNLTDGLVCYS